MKQKIHFLGIGGIGMSAIAQYLFDKNYEVSGSDMNENSEMVQFLKKIGIEIIPEDEKDKISEKNIFIRTSAIKEDNELLRYILKKEKKILRRADALGEICQTGKQFAIAGTHGKTTTSAILSHILHEANLKPSAFIGGIMSNYQTNFLNGNDNLFVLEADEYDRSFLTLSPYFLGITNIDIDHLDIYEDLDDILSTFKKLMTQTSFLGKIFLNNDDKNSRRLSNSTKENFLTYAIDSEAVFQAKNLNFSGVSSSFDFYFMNKKIGKICMDLPGKYNVYNALLATAMSFSYGVEFEQISGAMQSFRGIKRRFQYKGTVDQTDIFEDYAHHPKEIQSVLDAIDTEKNLLVFQPHLYSRTKDFYEEFAKALSLAKNIVLLPIYPAREKPIKDVSSKLIYDILNQKNLNVEYLEKNITEELEKIIKNYKQVLYLGAGDIFKYFNELILRNNEQKFKNIKFNKSLKKISQIKIGKTANYCYAPNKISEIKNIYKSFSQLKKIIPIGNASNILFSENIDSVLILDRNLPKILEKKSNQIVFSSNTNINEVIKKSNDFGLCGLEFLAGIPANLGGIISMNAGAFQKEISEFVEWIEIIDNNGDLKKITKEKLKFDYRKSNVQGFIVNACLNFQPIKDLDVDSLKKKYLKKRKNSQPQNFANLGCIFKNPKNDSAGRLIDLAGLKNFEIGDAFVSKKHANFLCNRKNSSYSEFMKLINFVQKKVYEKFKIHLKMEIKVVK